MGLYQLWTSLIWGVPTKEKTLGNSICSSLAPHFLLGVGKTDNSDSLLTTWYVSENHWDSTWLNTFQKRDVTHKSMGFDDKSMGFGPGNSPTDTAQGTTVGDTGYIPSHISLFAICHVPSYLTLLRSSLLGLVNKPKHDLIPRSLGSLAPHVVDK